MNASHTTDIDLDQLVDRLREKRVDLQEQGVVSLRIFGSRARRDNRPASDLDVLIEYDRSRKFSLVDLIHVEHWMQALLGLDVQITTGSSVPSVARERIDSEAVQVI